MLSQHPANLILRAVLFVVTLVSVGQWAWAQVESPPQPTYMQYIYSIGLPLLIAISWFVFTSPDDPNVSRKPIIPVSGNIRLSLEFVTFTFGIWSLLSNGRLFAALALAFGIFLHYYWSLDRIVRLIRKENND